MEASVPSLSVGVAILSLVKWLSDTRRWVDQEGPQVLCEEVEVVVGRVRHNRENNLSAVKEGVQALLRGLGAPVRYCQYPCSRLSIFIADLSSVWESKGHELLCI